MPSLKSNKREIPGWLLNQPIAHRGLHDISKGVPENSSAAFSLCLSHNLAIELDIQLSNDGHAVIMHDASLLRTTGRDALVADLSLAELQALTLEQTDETLPSLQETLNLISGSVPLVIEIKPSPHKKEDYIRALIKRLDGYSGPIAVQSFDPFLLMELRRQRPDIIRGQLGMNKPPAYLNAARRYLVKSMPFLRNVQADYVAYNVAGLKSSRITKLKKRGIPILAWTVDDLDKLAISRSYANNIIFEKLPLGEL